VELDDTVCYCFHIRKRKIVNYVRNRQLRRASQLSECGGAGTGCGWCIPFLEKYFAQHQAGRLEEGDTLTPAEYARQRGAYIRAGGGVPPAGAIPPPDEDSGSGNSS